ncbi:hypothetical protein B0H14DRAFT_357282 [Mycena olivaceomarginata]|nr:hypothetical protein B0H14DRAFT_357282 [Mycena olivaceomarginata]
MFETAAHFHPERIFNLLLVSRRVHEWIDGMQYDTVTPEGDRWSCPVHALRQAIQSNSKPATFFHRNVRHLFVFGEDPDDEHDAEEALRFCSGIKNLVLSVRTSSGWRILPRIVAMKPQRLSLRWDSILISMHPHQPTFTCLTHLFIFDNFLAFSDVALARLPWHVAELPVLTHLAMVNTALFGGGDPVLEKAILAVCKALKVLIVSPEEPQFGMEYLPRIDDIRFVYINIQDAVGFLDEWLAQTRGGIDFWARADAFVEKKRRGEIQPGSFTQSATN